MAEVAEVDWERDLKAEPVQAEESVVDLGRSVPDSGLAGPLRHRPAQSSRLQGSRTRSLPLCREVEPWLNPPHRLRRLSESTVVTWWFLRTFWPRWLRHIFQHFTTEVRLSMDRDVPD